MFTGIVEELGTVVAAGTKLEVHCSTVLSDLAIGASVAVKPSSAREMGRGDGRLTQRVPPGGSRRRRRTGA